MKKSIFIVVFFSILLFGQSLLASTGWVTRTYSVLVEDIKLVVNNIPVETKVERFLIDNREVTMVSLRELAEILDFTVDWDGTNKSININSQHKSPDIMLQSYWDSYSKKPIDDLKVIRNVGPFYINRTDDYYIAGRPFSHGVAVELSQNKTAEIVLDLHNNFRTFQGYIGVDDETMNSFGGYTIEIFGDDRELFASETIKPSDYPRYISPGEIDLTRINRMAIRIHWENIGIGDYENTIAVLANFIFYEK